MTLQSLASKQQKEPLNQPNSPSSRRTIDRLSAWLPLYIVLGFLGLGWLMFGDHILPSRSVEIVTVLTLRTDTDKAATPSSTAEVQPASSFEGKPLFQASGWIEADPLQLRVTTLLDGVVDEVFVLEGEEVKTGQLLATLIAEDAEIAVLEAEARLAGSKAEAERAESEVRQIEARIKTHALQVTAIKAELEILRDEAVRFESAGNRAFSERDVHQARLRLLVGEAELAAQESRNAELEIETESAQQAVATARQRIELANASLKRAKLQLSRTRILSPIDGVIQELYAAPGRKRMLGMDDPESATIAKLFQPQNLQARIDVPMEEAAQLFIGQAVLIRTNFLPNREFRGFVTRIVGMADIQRNTLQAKIAFEAPDLRLRPDMLCRAEFLSSPSPEKEGSDSKGRVTVFVPEDALLERSGSNAFIWSLDESGEKSTRREIRLGNLSRDGFVEVVEGLLPGEPVIVNAPANLKTGERVRPQNP